MDAAVVVVTPLFEMNPEALKLRKITNKFETINHLAVKLTWSATSRVTTSGVSCGCSFTDQIVR